MPATKKPAKQQIKFNDLHTSLKVLLVAVVVGVMGIIFLSVSDAAPLSWQDRIKLFNGGNRRVYIPPPNSGLPQSTGSSINCSNSSGSSVTTGSATADGGNGGTSYANTGGNTACGQ